jgi:hypothetical protein
VGTIKSKEKMKLKFIATMLFSLVLSVLFGSAVAQGLGTDPVNTIGTFVGISAVTSFVQMPQGVISALAQKTLIDSELIKAFRHEHTYLASIPSKDSYVHNDVIDLIKIGVDPDVLVNTTTYPIPSAQRTDTSIPVALNRFDTENTIVTDAEIYSLTYDKQSTVRESHISTLLETTAIHGLHNLGAQEDTSGTPVLETTGADDGTGRKRLKSTDLIRLRKALKDAGFPVIGWSLVLCGEHVEDLLIEDVTLRRAYQDHVGGMIAKNYYGFALYEDTYTVNYTAAGAKKAWGAAAATGDRAGSIAYLNKRVFKAKGSMNYYLGEAKRDPKMRQTEFGVRQYHIVLPYEQNALAAILSAPVA